jgi:apolipoprotein D and lipocalin family protein
MAIRSKISQFTLIGLILFLAGYARAEVKTVPYVDVARYLGTWYQIARNPLFFEAGCVCSRQILTANGDGRVAVYNTCNDQVPTGPLKEIRGFATSDDPVSNSKFTIDFDLPHKGQYWVIAVDNDYRYAVVSDSSGKSLYVLSKTPKLDSELLAKAINEGGMQVSTSKLELTVQQGCTYP